MTLPAVKKKKENWQRELNAGLGLHNLGLKASDLIDAISAGHILLKKNFDFDFVASTISMGQRVGQWTSGGKTGEKGVWGNDGDWATGHVAIGLTGNRVAEQTGVGVSINTFGVNDQLLKDQKLAEHQIANVYYEVYECQSKQTADLAAKFAESFALARPCFRDAVVPAGRTHDMARGLVSNGAFDKEHHHYNVFGQKKLGSGNYDLGTAVTKVFGNRANHTMKTSFRDLDEYSRNIYDYCTSACDSRGHRIQRKDMYCSAFVAACYQAAVYYQMTHNPGADCRGGLDINARNLTPRIYDAKLQASGDYRRLGVFRWIDLPEGSKLKTAVREVFAKLQQAEATFANLLTTSQTGNQTVQRVIVAKRAIMKDEGLARSRFGGHRVKNFFKAKEYDDEQIFKSLLTPEEMLRYQGLHDVCEMCRRVEDNEAMLVSHVYRAFSTFVGLLEDAGRDTPRSKNGGSTSLFYVLLSPFRAAISQKDYLFLDGLK